MIPIVGYPAPCEMTEGGFPYRTDSLFPSPSTCRSFLLSTISFQRYFSIPPLLVLAILYVSSTTSPNETQLTAACLTMDQYQQDLITSQLLDIGFMPHQLDDLSYQLQDSSLLLSPPVKGEAFESGYVDLLAEHQQPLDSRSYSYSSAGSQSLSPRIHNQHHDLSHLQLNNLSFGHAPDSISPTTIDTSRKETDEEGQRAEVSST